MESRLATYASFQEFKEKLKNFGNNTESLVKQVGGAIKAARYESDDLVAKDILRRFYFIRLPSNFQSQKDRAEFIQKLIQSFNTPFILDKWGVGSPNISANADANSAEIPLQYIIKKKAEPWVPLFFRDNPRYQKPAEDYEIVYNVVCHCSAYVEKKGACYFAATLYINLIKDEPRQDAVDLIKSIMGHIQQSIDQILRTSPISDSPKDYILTKTKEYKSNKLNDTQRRDILGQIKNFFTAGIRGYGWMLLPLDTDASGNYFNDLVREKSFTSNCKVAKNFKDQQLVVNVQILMVWQPVKSRKGEIEETRLSFDFETLFLGFTRFAASSELDFLIDRLDSLIKRTFAAV